MFQENLKLKISKTVFTSDLFILLQIDSFLFILLQIDTHFCITISVIYQINTSSSVLDRTTNAICCQKSVIDVWEMVSVSDPGHCGIVKWCDGLKLLLKFSLLYNKILFLGFLLEIIYI